MIICVKSMVGISVLDINTVKKNPRQKENKDVFQRQENPYVYINFIGESHFIPTFVVS